MYGKCVCMCAGATVKSTRISAPSMSGRCAEARQYVYMVLSSEGTTFATKHAQCHLQLVPQRSGIENIQKKYRSSTNALLKKLYRTRISARHMKQPPLQPQAVDLARQDGRKANQAGCNTLGRSHNVPHLALGRPVHLAVSLPHKSCSELLTGSVRLCGLQSPAWHFAAVEGKTVVDSPHLSCSPAQGRTKFRPRQKLTCVKLCNHCGMPVRGHRACSDMNVCAVSEQPMPALLWRDDTDDAGAKSCCSLRPANCMDQ